ncbi:unnamed protein product, partial [marine sediment metagenome]
MVESFEERGGEIRFNALVDQIIVKDGKAKGVKLLNGDIYLSKGIISNVNPICTAMKMLPQEKVSNDYKKKIFSPQIGPSAFSVYLGLNVS